MLIFIPFGTHYRDDKVGKVAEYCLRCFKPRTHLVIDRYRVDWVFIPLGSGTFVETVLQCKSCREYYLCDLDAFEQIVSADEEYSLDDLIDETNPRLHSRRSASAEFTTSVENSPGSLIPAEPEINIQATSSVNAISFGPPSKDGDDTTRKATNPSQVSQLIEKIAPYAMYGEPYVRLYDRLKYWDTLSVADKEKLGRQVEKFIARRRIEEFLADVTQTYPTWNVLVNLTIAAGAFLATGLSALWLFLYYSDEKIPVKLGPLLIFAAYGGGFVIGLLIIVFSVVNSFRKRSWFVRTLIPSAVVREIDLEDILDWLAATKDFKQHETPRVAAMRKDVWRFRSLVRVHGSKAADRVAHRRMK